MPTAQTRRTGKEPCITTLPEFGTHLSLERDDRRVDIEWIGEGIDGDYQESDADDYPHLRFTVLEQEGTEREQVEGTSYACRVDARSDDTVKTALADRIHDEIQGHGHLRRICERLSWLRVEDLGSGIGSAPRI